jgi:hypothetical protein
MTPQDVLAATMRSIDPHVLAAFGAIAKEQKELAEARRKQADHEERVNQLAHQMALLERDKEDVEAYQALQRKVRALDSNTAAIVPTPLPPCQSNLITWRRPWVEVRERAAALKAAENSVAALHVEKERLQVAVKHPEALVAAAKQAAKRAATAQSAAEDAAVSANEALGK